MRTLVLAALLLPAPLAASAAQTTTDLRVTVLMNGFSTDARVNNSDVPQFVLPTDPADPLGEGALGGTIRQTRATLTARMDAVEALGGAAVDGELDVDFFGGQQPSTGGRTFPLPRIRRAFAVVAWPSLELLVGQESPPIAMVSPSSLASVGFPGFASAGNLWLWLPQVRVTGLVPLTRAAEGGPPLELGIEAAALAPTSGEPQDPFTTRPDRAERSRRPYLQGRVLARWGEGDEAGEVGVGGHLGWLALAGGERATSKALAASALLPVGRMLELRAEAFTGEALAGLGGGGIGQSLGPGDVPVRTRGGWVQLNVRPAAGFELGASAGMDDPEDEDLPAAGAARLRNRVIAGHLLWRPGPLLVGLEVRELRTRYPAPTAERQAVHVNLALGMEL